MASGAEVAPAVEPAPEDLTGRRVAVTGGPGFIGGDVVAALCRLGADVLSVDRRPAIALRCHPDGDHGVTVVTGDLRESAVVEASPAPGTRALAHMAAQTQVLRSIEDPDGAARAWGLGPVGGPGGRPGRSSEGVGDKEVGDSGWRQ
jgi:NAD(P)-dependent dehydrogenase (short-subunit alcohol dehydrogenase family)